MPTALRWVALALLGVLVAVAVSIAASGLVSRQIGLASEPISAGDALAPSGARAPHRHKPRQVKPVEPTTTTEAQPPTTEAQPPTTEPEPEPEVEPPAESKPHGGEGDHSGGSGGGGADD